MELQGLSTEQAPPLSAPIRFFLTAPLFGILAGILIFFSETNILVNRFSMDSIIITHVLTIGFLGFVMLGALTQMLPVLASAKIPKIEIVSKYSYILLVIGSISMYVGLFQTNSLFTTIAFIGLGSGFLLILIPIAIGIKSVNNFTPTIKGMATSLFFALSIVFMGLYLLYGYITSNITATHLLIANVHSVWAVFGFAYILIISVAFQVLPMFYVYL